MVMELLVQTNFHTIIFLAVVAVTILFFILFVSRNDSLTEWADYIVGIIFILGSTALLFYACAAGGYKDLEFLFFAFGIGLMAGFVNWKFIMIRDYFSLHPLSFGAIIFSIVAASCYGRHWIVFGIFVLWSIFLLYIFLYLSKVDKKSEKLLRPS